MLRGLPDLAKENYRKIVIIGDYLTFNIPYLFLSKGDNFEYFTHSLHLKLISELVSSD